MNLAQFAKNKLREGVGLPVPCLSKVSPDWAESVLYREGSWQIELITIGPGVHVPPHRHDEVESLDMLLAGGGLAQVESLSVANGTPGRRFLRVPKGVTHQGHGGPDGAVYLSFQKWDNLPRFISEDWHEG